jgi:hypothetical protein
VAFSHSLHPWPSDKKNEKVNIVKYLTEIGNVLIIQWIIKYQEMNITRPCPVNMKKEEKKQLLLLKL